MRTIVEKDRREQRFNAGVEVHVDDGLRRYVTVTREVSKSGLFMFANPVPPRDARLQIVLHSDDHRAISLGGIVRYTIAEIGVGLELFGGEHELQLYRELVDRIAQGLTVWSTIGNLVRPRADSVPGGPGGSATPVPKLDDLVQTELIPIGETCRALEILFDRFPPVPPSNVQSGARQHLVGVSSEPVALRLHVRDRLRMLHVAMLADGEGYAAIIPPIDRFSSVQLFSLAGTEEIAISSGGIQFYPHFTDREIESIRRDVGSRAPQGFAVPPPRRVRGTTTDSLPAFPKEHLQVLQFKEWTRYEGPNQHLLELLLEHLDAETRVYQVGKKQRVVRLLRAVPVRVRDQASTDGRACALMHDGKRMCALFGLETGSPEIRPLTTSDEVIVRLDLQQNPQ